MTQKKIKPSCDNIINVIDDPFVIIDTNYHIIAVNNAYQCAFHHKDIEGKFCYEVSHGYQSPCSENGELCPIETVLTTGKTADVLHIHKHGEKEEHVQIRATPILDDAGDIQYIGETIINIEKNNSEPQLLIGRTPAILQLISLLHRVSPTNATVLIEGESGSGKECVANYIHFYSKRSHNQMIVIDCAAVTDKLIESELFGYEKGAFTGANTKKIGLIESADCSSIFIDEIGELSLDLQKKLLRFLESGSIRRIGGTHYFDVNVRIIAATNRDLKLMVKNGQFREDLYYRLAAFPVYVPPLRERKNDIPLIAENILCRIEHTAYSSTLSADVIDTLLSYDYPGNVRELRNILERAIILAAGKPLHSEHLLMSNPLHQAPVENTLSYQQSSNQQRTGKPSLQTIEKTLEKHHGHRLSAARELGMSERTLYRYLKKMNKADDKKIPN